MRCEASVIFLSAASFWFVAAAGAMIAMIFAVGGAAAMDRLAWMDSKPLWGPCAGDCGAAAYGGKYVDNGMAQVLFTDPETPLTWRYDDDYIVAAAASRRIATLWRRVDVEPEVGLGQRFGEQSETEVWGAFFLRYRGFPWDARLVTTAAVSTGLNVASGVSDKEDARAGGGGGARLMHFFAPEITLALPRAPQYELLFRFHHRSGVFGLLNDAGGGAQYATVGVRVRF